MYSWNLWLFIIQCSLINNFISSQTNANLLQSVFGMPSECIHQNVIRPCKLTFSCWLQGGKNAQGCGNKWLFSCCISDYDVITTTSLVDFNSNNVIQQQQQQQSPLINIDFNSIHSNKHNKQNQHNNHHHHNIHHQNNHNHHHHQHMHQNKIVPSSAVSINDKPLVLGKLKFKKFKNNTKKFILRRRTDEEILQLDCGIPRTAENTIQKRIIGGRPAYFAEYPWQAHIRIAEFQCGGVLVSRKFIATAAHCIQQAHMKDIIVYLGELDTQNSGHILEPYPAEKHRIRKKFIHPRFQYRVTQPDRYDLALLQLITPAGYKSHILPICLPLKPIDLTGKKGIIAGWGKTEVNMAHTGTNILQAASVPILDTEECILWHESKLINVEIYEEMFCAGHSDGHQDACLGDSGGPLIVLDDDGRFTLIGITSAGFGCGVDHQPGIYHNIQKTTKWIQSIIYQ